MRILRILTTGIQEVLASATRVASKVRLVLTRSDGYIDPSFLETNALAGNYVTIGTAQTVTGQKTFAEDINAQGFINLSQPGVNDVWRLRHTVPDSLTSDFRISAQGSGGPEYLIQATVDGNGDIVSTDLHSWRLNGTELMRLTTTGLGIGVSSPDAKLHVRDGRIIIQTDDNSEELRFIGRNEGIGGRSEWSFNTVGTGQNNKFQLTTGTGTSGEVLSFENQDPFGNDFLCRVRGNIETWQAGRGLIVTSPDGNTTKLIGIDNAGNIEVRNP